MDSPVTIDYMFKLAGFAPGDPICQWFDGVVAYLQAFKASALITIPSS
jgi:uncharacterized protein YodC (DUF2158 family)